MLNKIVNMDLEEYLKLMEITHLEGYEILALKTFIELKLVNLENKFLNPVLKIDSDIIGSIDKHNKIVTELYTGTRLEKINK